MRVHFQLLLLLLLSCVSAFAQDRPIGQWRAHLPYNSGQGVATDGTTLYCITQKGFFTYNTANGELDAFSKVEGMHETGTTAVACDRLTGTAIIGYANSNIDLYKTGTFMVMPDLKNKSFSGSKAINHIYADRGFAYVSTGLGVVVIDLAKEEVDETYTFSKGGQTMAVAAFTADSTYFYAATSGGLYRTARSNPQPQVFSTWTPVDTSRTYNGLATVQTVLFGTSHDTLFSNAGGTAMHRVFWRDSTTITRIDGGAQTLYAGMFTPKTGAGRTYHLSAAGAFVDSSRVAYPKGTVETSSGEVWAADLYQGLGHRRNGGGLEITIPNGPNGADNTGLYAHNGEVWVAHGGVNMRFYTGYGSNAGMSSYIDGVWRAYNPYNFAPLSGVLDLINITKDERTGTVYAGSLSNGMVAVTPDGGGYLIARDSLEPNLSDPNSFPVTGAAVDAAGNLWVAQNGALHELAVRTTDGVWHHYSAPSAGRAASGMLIDDAGYKWYYGPLGGGATVYNDGGTPDNGADDSYRPVNAVKGAGNLPNSAVRSLLKDRDGAIWIGTDDGIAIMSSPSCAIDPSCDAEQRVVQYDQFAGYLFKGESVRAMAVDGGNRKWIGTTNGLWLLSPDANKIISHFTVDNSPLPSNVVQSIALDGRSGDVYIGTEDGLISYRGTATDGGTTAGAVQVFPNPVQAGYSGPIAIRGLTTDADVRITDVAGQLVYRAKATGGQAVWNGLDYTGARPQSGVYLIFATNRDGSQTSIGKVVLMH